MNKIYDTIIVGSGPAGLTCALYLSRANKDVLIIEKSTPGGKLSNINEINNYPGINSIDGASLAYNMYKQVKDLNVPFIFEEVKSINKEDYFILNTNNNTYYSKTVVLAMGSYGSKRIIPNIDKYLGKGLSTCVTCDGALYKNKDVLLLDNTIDVEDNINYLSNIVNKLYVITNKDINIKNNIIKLNSNLKSINGTNKIESITSTNNDLINIDGLFLIEEESIELLEGIKLENNKLVVSSNYETTIKGLYAIGDMVNTLKQVITASSSGAIASADIIKKLR